MCGARGGATVPQVRAACQRIRPIRWVQRHAKRRTTSEEEDDDEAAGLDLRKSAEARSGAASSPSMAAGPDLREPPEPSAGASSSASGAPASFTSVSG